MLRWALPAVLALLALVGAFTVPVDAVIESPGPTWNVLGSVDADGRQIDSAAASPSSPAAGGAGSSTTPLISVSGARTYPAAGALRMTTVSVRGCPGYPVTVADVVLAWMRRDERVVDRDEVCPRSMSAEQVTQAGQVQMEGAEQAAVAAAVIESGTATRQVLTISGTAPGQDADLREEDVLTAVTTAQGRTTQVTTFAQLRDLMRQVPAGSTLTLTVTRDGEEVTIPLTTLATDDGRDGSVLGVYLLVDADSPVSADFALQDVGGPSAGMMFALGIVDALTPGDLTAGLDVAGTGTIAADGSVGPIGGIEQKMQGAARDGSRYFLAPADNCGEVVGHEPDGLEVMAVSSLHEAVDAVRYVAASGSDPDAPAQPRTCQQVLGSSQAH